MKHLIIVILLLMLTLPALAKGGRGGRSGGGGHYSHSYSGSSYSKAPSKSYVKKKDVKVDSRKKPSKEISGDSNMAPDGNMNLDPAKTDAGKADAKQLARSKPDSDSTCHTGPRGGRYRIVNGHKRYGC